MYVTVNKLLRGKDRKPFLNIIVQSFLDDIGIYIYIYIHVLWQKSNETDFLLTMNFILFTNQGYPLQNSSLGQLHSDVGVVSILRSSAEKFLLVYLSARRLRSSGYYPKYQNGVL